MGHFLSFHSEAHMAETCGVEDSYQDGLTRLEGLIRDLAAFLPQILDLPAFLFDAELSARVKQIDARSRHYPERRELLKKMCFDLCAYALDQSELLWRIRHKPFGYAGDVEVLEMLYTGETHSQGVGRAWDAFVFRQRLLTMLLQRREKFGKVLREVCIRQSQVSVLSIAASVRDFLQIIKDTPDCAKKSLFYCLEPEAKAIAHYKKLLANNKSTNFIWENRAVTSLSLERTFDLIWLPRSLPYLNDEEVTLLVRNLWTLLSKGGVLLIAASQYPDEHLLLEWCTGWTLVQRSSEDTKNLFLQAGVPGAAVHDDGVCWRLERL
jgi:hypothetical protein